MILISNWPSEYNNLVTILETLREDKLIYICDRAIAECDRISRQKDIQKTDSALNTRHDGGGFSHWRGSDIGCGRGDFLRHIREIYQTDIKYHGVDMNKVLIGVASKLDATKSYTISCSCSSRYPTT